MHFRYTPTSSRAKKGIMSSSKSNNDVQEPLLPLQQVNNYQDKKDSWRTLLRTHGREFSVYGQNMTINNVFFKDYEATLGKHQPRALLKHFLESKLNMQVYFDALKALGVNFTPGIIG